MKKIKIIHLAISLLMFNISFAQYESGIIEYEATPDLTSFKIDLETNPSTNLVKKEILINSLYASKNLKFELKFKNNESTFNCISDLSKKVGEPMSINYTSIYSGAKREYYSNLKTEEKYKISHSFKDYLIKDKVDKWTITQESKMIGKYLCFKATTYRYTENINGEQKVKIIAWFTNEIPLSYGIQNLNGLPGLIIEIMINYNITFKVTNIDLNSENFTIQKPKGKVITLKEHTDLIKKRWGRI